MKRFVLLVIFLNIGLHLFADVRTDAMNCAMTYYTTLKSYALNPGNLDLEDKIKRLVIDGKGSIYNDIYTHILNKPETMSDIGNYLADIGGYKNRTGYSLHIEVTESSLSYSGNDSSSGYVTATKHVYCNYGRQKVDYTVRERMLVRNGRIVNIMKAPSSASHLTVSPSTVSIGSDGGSRILSVNTDGVWNVSSVNASWLHTTVSGNEVTLRIDKNESTSSRTGRVTIESGTRVANVSVVQQGRSTSTTDIVKGGEFTSVSASVVGENVVCKMSFKVRGMKGKAGLTSCYFYNSSNVALVDVNDSYKTTDGKVAVSKDINPSYDNSVYTDWEVSIPVRELHLTGTSPQVIKVCVSVWDQSVSPSKELFKSSYYSFTVTPVMDYLKVDGSTSDINRNYISADGMTETFSVSTNSDSYEIWGLPSWCSVEDRTSSSFKLRVLKNTSTAERSDYFKVKAAGKEIRFNLRQEASDGPNAVINRVWVDHNQMRTGYKTVFLPYVGYQQQPYSYYVMKIHVSFDVNYMKGKKVRVCAFFYDDDGNKMKASNSEYRTSDGQVTVQSVGNVTYENSTWNDFVMEIPYSVMKKGSNKFMIEIHDNNGKSLAESDYEYFSVN